MASQSDPLTPFWIRHKGEISFLAALSGLLAISALRIFLPELSPGILIVFQHAFEAATVGGAADWLAVKMIFDEIKIGGIRVVPASGIIPRKQAAIAKGAGNLVAQEWLSRESIQKALKDLDFADSAAGYLEQRTDEITDWILHQAAVWIGKESTAELVERWLHENSEKIRPSQWLARAVTPEMIEKAVHTAVPPIADALRRGMGSADAYQFVLDKMQAEQKGFFRQLFFDPVDATEKTILKIMEFLREVSDDGNHPIRRRLTEVLQKWAREASSTDRTAADKAVQEFLAEPGKWVREMVKRIAEGLEAQSSSQDGGPKKVLQATLATFISELRSSWKDSFNQTVREAIGKLLEDHHDKIAGLVESNLSQLSPDELKRQFKARTYDDMQWIRVNGAVAGFVIGALIGMVRSFLE